VVRSILFYVSNIASYIILDVPTSKFGDALRAQVEERLNFFETGAPPSKNADAIRKVLDELALEDDDEDADEQMADAEPILTTLEPTPRKEKKKRKSDSMDIDDDDEGHSAKKVKLSKEEKKALKKAKKEKKEAKNAAAGVSVSMFIIQVCRPYSHYYSMRTSKRRRKRKRKRERARHNNFLRLPCSARSLCCYPLHITSLHCKPLMMTMACSCTFWVVLLYIHYVTTCYTN
jgi:hypothetical protein